MRSFSISTIVIGTVAAYCLTTCTAADFSVASLNDVGRLAGGQRVLLQARNDEPIRHDREIWLLIHGNASGPKRMESLAGCIEKCRASASSQVLLLDWSGAAKSDWSAWGKAENHIDEVARLAHEKLHSVGIAGKNLHLVGHSFGAYVADRIAARFGKVASIIALDPATDVPDGFPFGGSAAFNPRKPGTIDFAQHATYSWSFRVADCPLGLDQTALTAHESFVLVGATHSSVVEIAAFLLQGSGNRLVAEIFALDRLISARRVDELCYDSLSIESDAEAKRIVFASAEPDAAKNFDAGLTVGADGRITDLRFVGVNRSLETVAVPETVAIASGK